MPLIGKEFRPGLRRSLRFQMDSGVRHVPVLYLKFGENSGDEAKDSSPYGNDGDIIGASWAKGILGPGLSFDGEDDNVNCGNGESLRFSDRLTVAVWIKTPTVQSQMLVRKFMTDWETFYWGWALRLEPTKAVILTWGDNTYPEDSITAADIYEAEEWFNLLATLDGETAKIYKNGVLMAQKDQTKSMLGNPEHPLYCPSPWVCFEGIMDEVRIYNRALTALEVLELYYGIE